MEYQPYCSLFVDLRNKYVAEITKNPTFFAMLAEKPNMLVTILQLISY